jgi:biotin transport system substrate-specific component
MSSGPRSSAALLGRPTLLDAVVAHRASRAVVSVAATLFMAALTAAAAQLTIPWTPVPFTLQPAVVLLGGAVLGSRLAFASQLLYLMAGVAGLPVFAASPFLPQGAARLLGPTGGYLLAYPFAAWLTGALAERRFDRRYLTSLLAMAAGLGVIFAGGFFRLAFVPPALGISRAFEVGIAPFLLADLVKLAVIAAVMPAAWRLLGGRT